MLEWSLLGGAVPAWLTGAGVLALLVLVSGRGRKWWLRAVPAVVASAGVVVLIATVVVEDVWRPFPDALPPVVSCLVWAGLLGAGLAVVRPPGGRARRSTCARMPPKLSASSPGPCITIAS